MLKKSITYKNFDGDTVTEDFYFNMTKAELVELELSESGGLAETLKAIIDSKDGAKIIEYFKKIILMSYGERSVDGRRFMKSPEIANSFSHTEAYSSLFMELATDAKEAADFVNGIMPSDLVSEASALPNEIPALQEEKETEVALEDKPIKELTAEEIEILLKKQQ